MSSKAAGARPLLLPVILSLVVAALTGGCGSTSGGTKTSAEVLLNERMAAVLLRDHRFHDAETTYRDVIRSDPKNPELYDGLGVALIMQSKVRDSLDPFDRAVKLSPDKGAYRVHRAMARIELGRYLEAEEDLRVAEASPVPEDRFDALVHRGRMRQRQGDYPAAEIAFTSALAREPKSFDALIGRGATREALGNFSGAAEDFLEAVRLQPKSADANLRLGLALVSLKKNALGRRYLERTVELDPGGDAGSKARLLLESTPPS